MEGRHRDSRMFSGAAKTLLKNYIRHTDTHNRMLEESDMWRQREDSKNRRLEEEPVRRRRAHMDDLESSSRGGEDSEQRKPDTFWMRQLQEAEEKDPDRWGHAGYKELHPEEFHSSLSESDAEKGSTTKKKRKKSKKEKKKKSKDKKKTRKHKKKKKSRDDEPKDKTRDEKSHKSDRTKHKRKRKDSSSDSDDSDSGSESPRKRQKFTSERPNPETNGFTGSDRNNTWRRGSNYRPKFRRE